MRQPIDLVGGFYTDESLPWSCQDTVNWIPVAAEVGGTRTPTKLVDAPGLRPWVWIGNHADGVDSAPIRGLHDVEGQLFAVCGQTLYRIRPDGIAIPLGTIPGVGRVSMSHNQQAVGNQLLVVNGTGGYVWNTGTEEFTVVTDDGYPGAFAVDFLDGYLMQVEPFGRFLFHSDLADALDYNTLDRFEAETAPDRVVGMIVNHREVWAFGERTIDIFDNVGTATGTFQNKGISLSRGCIAKWSPAVIDNGIAWLGDDRVVYHARGYDAIRISTRAIEVALAEIPLTDIRNAFSFVWADRGHAVYYLTVPNGQTFGYDFSTGLWHRRASWHPERDIGGRWRLNDLVRSNGRWIGGDYQTGKLYVLDWDYMAEGCDPLVRERVSPVAHADGRRFTMDGVEALFDTGGKATECQDFAYQPRGPRVSGEAPDGNIIEPYGGFTYTVIPGDNPVVSVELVGGELPDGIPFDGDTVSILPGYASTFGDFTITIRAKDSAGLYYDHTDTIHFSPIAFLSFSSQYGGLWASPDLDGWMGPLEFVPNYADSVWNATVSQGKVIADVKITSGSSQTERYLSLQPPPWGEGFISVGAEKVVESGISIVSSILHEFMGITVAYERNGNRGYYWVSSDGGVSWEKVGVPGDRRVRGIARLSSGRWVASFIQSISVFIGYSDEEVPRTWTPVANSGITNHSSNNSMASNGRYAFCCDNLRRVFRSSDGETWEQITPTGAFSAPLNAELFACSDGTIVAYGDNAGGKVARSVDDGETWTEVTFNPSGDITMLSEAGGLLLGSANHANFYTSEDSGATWQKHDPPFSGYNNRSALIAVDLSR